MDDLTAKLQAVAVFKQLPEAAALAAANKRVQNLLKKPMPSWARLTKACCNRTKKSPVRCRARFAAENRRRRRRRQFPNCFVELASVKPQVDAFFDGVMVMAEDAAVKQNRLNLLNRLAGQMNAVADIALLGE